MRRSKLNQHLNQLSEEELRAEINALFDKVDGVKVFYAMELGTLEERTRLYNQAKKDIRSKYATKSHRKPRRPRIQKINSILTDMRKKSIFSHELVDLYLFDVETATSFMIEYDFFSEVLAKHIITIFEKCTSLISDLRLQDEFVDRCTSLLRRLEFSPGIHLEVMDVFADCFKAKTR